MPTSISTRFVAKVARWVLPVNCLAIVTSCRATSSTVDYTASAHTADSIVTAISAKRATDSCDDFLANIDEWYFYPRATDSCKPQLCRRRVTVTRNSHTKTSIYDTVHIVKKAQSATTGKNKKASQNRPQSNRLIWIITAIITLLTTITIFKK